MGGEDGPPSAAALQVRCKKPCTKLKVWGNFTLGQSGDPAWKWEGCSNQTLGHRITCEQGPRWDCRSLAPSGWDPSTFLHSTPVWFGVFGWGSAKHGGGVGGKRHETWCETRSVLPWYIPIRCKVLLCVQQKTRMCNVGLWTKTCRCRRLCVCVFEVTQIPNQPRSATGAAAVEKPIPACAAVSYYDAPLALHFNTGPILTRYNTLNLI